MSDAPPSESDGTQGASGVLSIDAMGGDTGPDAVIAGLARAVHKTPQMQFVVHGDEAQLVPLIAKRKGLEDHITLRHAEAVVTMDDKPSQVMRSGKNTSMWSAIESVRNHEADVCVSCG
ncbi:MAG: phosphate acyltransferase, partial [Pseudomonadota bacterium]